MALIGFHGIRKTVRLNRAGVANVSSKLDEVRVFGVPGVHVLMATHRVFAPRFGIVSHFVTS